MLLLLFVVVAFTVVVAFVVVAGLVVAVWLISLSAMQMVPSNETPPPYSGYAEINRAPYHVPGWLRCSLCLWAIVSIILMFALLTLIFDAGDFLFIDLHICTHTHTLSLSLSLSLSICLSIYLSISICLYQSIYLSLCFFDSLF